MAYDPADERVKANLRGKKKRKYTSSHDDCECELEDYAADEDVVGAFATAEAEADLSPDLRGTTVRRWSGLLAPIGVPTGDGRRFADNALSSRELPIPIAWPRVDEGGHKSAVTVGRVDGINYGDNGEVSGWGIIFDPDPEKLPRLKQDADEAWYLLSQKTLGPSVDLDDMEFHPLGEEYATADGKQEIEVTKGRISRITLVPIPAFSEARPFSLDDLDADEYAEMTAVTAAGVASGMEQLPVADVEWDPIDWAITHRDEGVGALYERDGEAMFPVAALVAGAVQLVPGAVADAVSMLAFRADELAIAAGAQQAMRQELESLTAACGLPSPPWTRSALTAAAGVASTAPPVTLFADPKLPEPTPIRVERTPDGHLHYFGHVATWGVCHIGFPGQCVTAPRSRNGYAYFHTGSVETADKGRIKTGKVTLGGGHADTRLGFQAALGHYDDSGTAVADVRAGEDAHGIWVSGVVRPGVDEQRLSELAAAPLSGDWRHVGGGLELVAALAVNTPGFPVVNVRRHAGEDYALVAAGSLSTEARDKAADKGYALPDGSYPIRSVDELHKAIKAYGRAKDKAAAKAHIIKRARALKATGALPDGWLSDDEYASVQDMVRAEFARERRAQRAAETFAAVARDRVAEAAGVFA
jgi:hypothetical protein